MKLKPIKPHQKSLTKGALTVAHYKSSILPPCTYQGAKQRVSKEIVDYIISKELVYPSKGGTPIYDLCCGSGAVSLEFVSRGVSPSNITMLDASSWGKFWKSIGDGSFSLSKWHWWVNQVPTDKNLVQDFMKELATTNATEDEEYKYLLLQSSSFGGKQIWREGKEWKNTSFRSYWQPTETSKRQSPVNPMQPSIETLTSRVDLLSERMFGVKVIHDDIYRVLKVVENDAVSKVVYIDPPYTETTGYGFSFDRIDFLSELFNKTLSPIYVSECKPLSDECIRLNFNGAKGGISGKKSGKNEEWLSVFR